jgi:hypothetical protein
MMVTMIFWCAVQTSSQPTEIRRGKFRINTSRIIQGLNVVMWYTRGVQNGVPEPKVSILILALSEATKKVRYPWNGPSRLPHFLHNRLTDGS